MTWTMHCLVYRLRRQATPRGGRTGTSGPLGAPMDGGYAFASREFGWGGVGSR
jgi:hypothetical protein